MTSALAPSVHPRKAKAPSSFLRTSGALHPEDLSALAQARGKPPSVSWAKGPPGEDGKVDPGFFYTPPILRGVVPSKSGLNPPQSTWGLLIRG